MAVKIGCQYSCFGRSIGMKLEIRVAAQNGLEAPRVMPKIIPIEASDIVCIK